MLPGGELLPDRSRQLVSSSLSAAVRHVPTVTTTEIRGSALRCSSVLRAARPGVPKANHPPGAPNLWGAPVKTPRSRHGSLSVAAGAPAAHTPADRRGHCGRCADEINSFRAETEVWKAHTLLGPAARRRLPTKEFSHDA
ncbi:hypothetical protein GCM10010394_26200 [Streptomyces crystallinus]|uniref:Uncharacterized protein n=1 Tax=Streptomyces crystallinus TaxID=68191 RepID=A0ABP3QT12_9ACTN